MTHIWKNTYHESMGDYFSHVLKDEKQVDIFYMLWSSFRLTFFTMSAFFQHIRVGDENHELWVHKSNDGTLTVKYIIK